MQDRIRALRQAFINLFTNIVIYFIIFKLKQIIFYFYKLSCNSIYLC